MVSLLENYIKFSSSREVGWDSSAPSHFPFAFDVIFPRTLHLCIYRLDMLEWTTSLVTLLLESAEVSRTLHAFNYRVFKCFLLLSCISCLLCFSAVTSILFSFHSPFPCHPSSEGILPFTNDQCNGKKEITSGIFIYKCDLNGQKETDFNFLKWNVFVMQEQVQGGK